MNYSKELIVGSILSVLFIILVFSFSIEKGFVSKQIQTSNIPSPSSQNKESTYSVDEVAKHDTENDCWLIISNKVYDVTKYISFHPGGSQTIVQYCGNEATTAFASIRKHGLEAQTKLSSLLVGLFK